MSSKFTKPMILGVLGRFETIHEALTDIATRCDDLADPELVIMSGELSIGILKPMRKMRKYITDTYKIRSWDSEDET